MAATLLVGPLSPNASAQHTCHGRTVTIVGSGGADKLGGTPGPDVIAGLGGNDLLVGFGGNDVICGGDGNDDLSGLGGNDVLVGGGGYYDRHNKDRSFQNRLLGDAGNDLLIGGPGFDVLGGHAGNDRLLGKGGGDAVVGHGGDDVLEGGGGSFDFFLPMGGDDKVEGGPGLDRLSYYGSGAVRANLDTGIATGAGRDRVSGFEQLEGSNKRDHLTGNRRQNFLFGLRGNDVLRGLKGDDLLLGQKGSDRLDGGVGEDVASFYFSRRGATADLRTNRGSDGTGVDKFVSIMGLEGSGSPSVKNTLEGDDAPNYLVGSRGAEGGRINGRGGRDVFVNYTNGVRLSGGDGRDRVGNFAHRVFFTGDGGNDRVLSQTSVTMRAEGGPGEDSIQATEATGDEGGDVLIGRKTVGGAGNDVLVASARRANTLTTLLPGAGDDVVFPWDGRNLIGHTAPEDATSDTPHPDQGLDVVSYVRLRLSGVSIDLFEREADHGDFGGDRLVHGIAAFVGSRFTDHFTGNDLADSINGWKGDDTLRGMDGNDRLDGGAGEDLAYGGLGLDDCPRVESKNECEDIAIPAPPLAPSADEVSDLIARLRRQRMPYKSATANLRSLRKGLAPSQGAGSASRLLDLAARR